ncbi:MAG: ABC transporter permease, partial [Pseudomonadota bacterium]
VGLATVVLVWWALFRTRFGLRLRAVGENPESVDTAGVSVVRMRYIAVIICGVLCGLAGAHLATGIAAGFVKDMSAGRGFIALAALIFAKWRPGAALLACLLFGLLEAIAIRFQNIDIPTFISLMSMIGFFAALLLSSAQGLKVYAGQLDPGSLKAPFLWLAVTAALFGLVTFVIDSDSGLGALVLPVQFMQALPYILTVIILAGFVGKAIPPRAGGEPYVKER